MRSSRIVNLHRIKNAVGNCFETLKKDNISLYAAESAFYIILSTVPFLLLIFTVIRMIMTEETVEYIYSLEKYIPDVFGNFFRSEIKALAERPTPAPLSFSAFGVLWSSSKGVRAVRRGIRAVYGAERSSLAEEFFGGIFMTAVFIILIAASVVFLVFGGELGELLENALPNLGNCFKTVRNFSPIVFPVFTIMFFTFVFRSFAPEVGGMKKYRDHFPGAVSAAVGWVLYSYIFSVFLKMFSNMSYIYGSLATLMSFMLWLYIIVYILFTGAELNKYIFQSRN